MTKTLYDPEVEKKEKTDLIIKQIILLLIALYVVKLAALSLLYFDLSQITTSSIFSPIFNFANYITYII